jgi:hypothetical protein
MKLILRIKCVNPDFSQEFADTNHNGKETEDNVHYNWEDELEVKKKVVMLKVKNNVSYQLEGVIEGEKFSHEIPACTVIECTHEDTSVSLFPFSKRIIRDTEKKQSKDGNQVWFTVYLKGKMKIVNPFDGGYFAKEDFPFDIPEAEAEEPEEEEDDVAE